MDRAGTQFLAARVLRMLTSVVESGRWNRLRRISPNGLHRKFAHCIYLALFDFREGRTDQALAGVRLALDQPFIEPMGTDGNKFYLGQNGALIAYLDGDYDLARPCVTRCWRTRGRRSGGNGRYCG